MQLESQIKELEIRELELAKREAENETQRKIVAKELEQVYANMLISGLPLRLLKFVQWHYFQNAAIFSYAQLAAVEQQKTREKVQRLAVDHKVWECFLL